MDRHLNARRNYADHPEVVAAINQIAADVVASSGCALCVLVDSPDEVDSWRERGAGIVLFNSTTILANAMRATLGRVRINATAPPC